MALDCAGADTSDGNVTDETARHVSTDAPTSYAVRASTTSPGRARIMARDEPIDVDSSWSGEPSALPGPGEVLAAALAACLLKNLERLRVLVDFHYESAQVDVTARRRDMPPSFVEFEYEVRVTTEETEHRVELVHTNLRKYGTVFNTLAASCDVHGRMVIVKPADHG